jgi:tetratricopeptide (TPR) repeat protein
VLEDQAAALEQEARAAITREDWVAALDLLERRLSTGRRIAQLPGADLDALFYALHNVGEVALTLGLLERARQVFEEALRLAESMSTDRHLTVGRVSLAFLDVHEGRFVRAEPVLRQFLADAAGRKEHRGTTYMLEWLAAVAANTGRARRALLLAGNAAAERERSGDPRPRRMQEQLDAMLRPARQALGAAAAAIWEEGSRMSLDEVVAYALTDE